ncbi:hypothetical protein MGA3_04110 [Bacillus methanolicus MGA3]|nr:hypothetical protein MGA3_04110 [Bacillus methanolicus MGA3]
MRLKDRVEKAQADIGDMNCSVNWKKGYLPDKICSLNVHILAIEL